MTDMHLMWSTRCKGFKVCKLIFTHHLLVWGLDCESRVAFEVIAAFKVCEVTTNPSTHFWGSFQICWAESFWNGKARDFQC